MMDIIALIICFTLAISLSICRYWALQKKDKIDRDAFN